MQRLVSAFGGVFAQTGAQYAVGLVQDVGPVAGVRLRVHPGQGRQPQVGVRLEQLPRTVVVVAYIEV
ncbi:hypothetical protein CLM62_40845 [Streptomyces sp. SA15]|uniref:hypothetical protein n=1 Tax=Streptomyces sp. SA15 TaxID=934019 RepID=UPI000BB03A14|nr:hypothetical protein [Streptomyces sp. SA15]PAZ10497.1 hypothetical protein CLM62_40845 [Streptomyces sp. SA15]